jgi:hypothetical protein
MRVRVAVGWRSQRARRESEEARADGARQRGRARGSRAVGSRARARTHEAVQLPASVADLDAALPKVNADDFARGYFLRSGPKKSKNAFPKKLTAPDVTNSSHGDPERLANKQATTE